MRISARGLWPVLFVASLIVAFSSCERHHVGELASESGKAGKSEEVHATAVTPAPAGTPGDFFRENKSR